jgi:hypothetical protein
MATTLHIAVLITCVLTAACAARKTESATKSATGAAIPASDTTAVPATVAEAARRTIAAMNGIEQQTLRNMRRGDVPSLLHGYQMTARYSFGLSDGTNTALLRSCGSPTLPVEECLLVILDAAWLLLQKE